MEDKPKSPEEQALEFIGKLQEQSDKIKNRNAGLAKQESEEARKQLRESNKPDVPKGFIEVTIPTEQKDKVLIAVRTIGSIRPIDWMETPRASISFKDDFTRSTEPDEQEVLESYDELKRLLAAAH